MTTFRKIIQCPSCRFANRLGDTRCLICKTELPADAAGGAPSGKPPAKVAAPAKPAPKQPLNPASNAAANARLAAQKASAPPKPAAPPSKPGAVLRPPPGKAPPRPTPAPLPPRQPEPKTLSVKRPATFATEMSRPAIDPAMLEDEAPPKPLTKRVERPASETPGAVGWIWCEPLAPIPLLPQRQVTVGRHDGCDLVLPHKEVSRHHACFKVSGRQITLEDQGSSNGCYVNGKRCASQIVKVGDRIQIGPYEVDIRAKGTADEGDSGGDTKSFDLTSVQSGGPNASMTGKLADVSLVEILQGIEFNSKTCTLAISDGKLRGEIVFAAGRPVHATFGADRDLDAVRAMLRLKDGRFVLSNQVEAVEQTMATTVTALLLDASRAIDEATRAPEAPPPEEAPAPPEEAPAPPPRGPDADATDEVPALEFGHAASSDVEAIPADAPPPASEDAAPAEASAYADAGEEAAPEDAGAYAAEEATPEDAGAYASEVAAPEDASAYASDEPPAESEAASETNPEEAPAASAPPEEPPA